MDRSGLSRGFIAGSIKRLEASGLMDVNHSTREGQCNQYKFKKLERFERVPYEFFEANDLSIYEKAMLLCLRQFFNQGALTTLYSVTKLAECLGLSYSQVYKPYRSLVNKGYIIELLISNKCSDHCVKKVFISKKLNWLYDYDKPKAFIKTEFKIMVA